MAAADADGPPPPRPAGWSPPHVALRLAPLVLLLVAAGLSGAASAHHTNPACQSGGFNVVWSTPQVFSTPQAFFDDCILVQADVTIDPDVDVRFRDVALVFDNNLGNLTVNIGNNATFEFQDGGGPTTADDGRLEVLNFSVTWSSFMFNISQGARFYVNHTAIIGGGVPRLPLGWMSGIYVPFPTDFAWNFVDHTTFANGLMLVGYRNATTISDYGVTQGGYSLYLSESANLTLRNFKSEALSLVGALINDSQNLSIFNFASNASTSSIIANRVTGLRIFDARDGRHSSIGIDLNTVTNATLQRIRLWRLGIGGGTFGLELENSKDITVRDIELTQHTGADLHLRGVTQDVNVTNATIRQGFNARGIWVEVSGSPHRLRFDQVNVSSKGAGAIPAVQIQGASSVFFNATFITTNQGTGYSVEDCSDVLFVGGSISLNGGDGAYLRGSNLTIERTLVSTNFASGLLVGGGAFILERVTFTMNQATVRSAGVVALRGQSTIANSTLPGGSSQPLFPLDAVVLASDGDPASRLYLFNNTFSSAGVGSVYGYSIRADGIYRLEAYANSFQGMPLWFQRCSFATLRDNVYVTTKMALGAVALLIGNATQVNVSRELFVNTSAPAGLSTVIRVQDVLIGAGLANMRLPLADFGIFVSVAASGSPSRVDVENVTIDARRTGLAVAGATKITVDQVTVSASADSIILIGGGADQDITVKDVRLRATGQALKLQSDALGTVTVANLTLNASAAPPVGVVDVTNGFNVSLRQVDTDGAAYGVNISEARRVFLSRINFTNNTVGFNMSVRTGNSSLLNWTVDTPTTIFRSSFRFNGEITVAGQTFAILASSISVYATTSEPRASRFILLGSSTITVSQFSNITGEPGTNGPQQVHANFTIEMSAQARAVLSDANLTGLGDPSSALPERQGLVIRSDTTVDRVRFVYAIKPLQAIGAALTVTDCTFSGVSAIATAVTISQGATLTLSQSQVNDLDGVWADSSDMQISDTFFGGSGTVLALFASTATIQDAVVNDPSLIVLAAAGSEVDIWRLISLHILDTGFDAQTNSRITVRDSHLRGALFDAKASGGGLITFNNSVIERFAGDTTHVYNTRSAPSGQIEVTWRERFGVRLLSSGDLVASNLSVLNASGAIFWEGMTPAGDLTPSYKLREYDAVNGVETYHPPFRFTATVGALTQSFSVSLVNGSDIILDMDDVPPLIRITCPPFDFSTSNATVTLCAYAQDDESGLAPTNPCVRFNGGTCQYYQSASFEEIFNLVEGPNTMEIIARDIRGNEAHAWRNVTKDTTPPVFATCDPGDGFRTSQAVVLLTCFIEGDPVSPAQISGLPVPPPPIAPDGTLIVQLTLTPGPNAFSISVIDALGNIAVRSFSWALVADPPRPTGCRPFNTTVTIEFQYLVCNVPAGTVNVTVNGAAVNFNRGNFSAPLRLQEGNNSFTLVVTNDVGISYHVDFWLLLDSTTNCVVFTPARNPDITNKERIVVGGRCDPDVQLTISTVSGTVTPDAAGYWSANVGLARGENTIEIVGQDANGAKWDVVLRVTYSPGGETGDAFILIVFVLLAAGVLAAAFFISRRPRRRDEFEPVKPSTGAQKAPPRPAQPSYKLPERPEDLTYRPRPPPPPPPPGPPRP